ncbi:peptidylprolyl isomerase [Falsihalocynthiibacter sp. SS001]|uniref:peptidylprolyl isomerase n=1 Tax=Falsihalocynthiibacter sp. SS001 TaxID=3349698 RepID=UPI0036D23610
MNKSKGELMLKRTKFGILAAFLATTGVAVAQDSTTGWDTVIATVNGEDITAGQMIIARENLPQQYQALEDGMLYDGILENLIQQILLVQSVSDDLTERQTATLEHQKRTFLAGVTVEEILSEPISDEALGALYQEEFVNAESETEYSAAHILVETEEEAQEIAKLLEEGAEFAELAKEKSTGPSGPNGGNLGWFGAGAMVAPFEEAVVALEDGAYSDPVQTQFGWHLIHRIESRIKETPSFEEVRPQLVAQLSQKALEEEIVALTDKAEITKSEEGAIDPSFLSDPALVGE